MKTDALIDLLATGAGAVDTRAAMLAFAAKVAAGTLVAVGLMLVFLGPRHDFAQAIAQPMFWIKLAYVAALAASATWCAYRLARPGMRAGAPVIVAILAFGAMALGGALALATAEPVDRGALFFGSTWRKCPWLIVAIAVPVFATTAWAMRGLAPTRLRAAGAAAGFAAGGIGALVYSFHCTEMGAPFLATWYALGVLVPTAAGYLLGERLLRWR